MEMTPLKKELQVLQERANLKVPRGASCINHAITINAHSVHVCVCGRAGGRVHCVCIYGTGDSDTAPMIVMSSFVVSCTQKTSLN